MEGPSSPTTDSTMPPQLEDIGKYTQDVLKTVVSATRCAKTLPKLGENYELYNSYPVFAELMKVEGDRILHMISKLFKHAGAQTQILDSTILPDERVERLSDANDFLLERVGNWLDEAAGLRRPEDLVVVGPDTLAPLSRTIGTSWNRARKQPLSNDGDALKDASKTLSSPEKTASPNDSPTRNKPVRLLTSFNVTRPQINFSDQIDNSNKPFVPKLRFKHNASERARRENVRIMDDEAEEGPVSWTTGNDAEKPSHPYKYELDHYEPQSWQFEYPNTITYPPPVEETPLIHVHTEKGLQELCRTLKSVREFAVDLESHSYRSFQGLTCLMQISTRTSDYIIDTLALWRHMHILNDPFTDPAIVKVFHGANMDVGWLQRDFGIYVVNMFDTGQAMRLLNFARLSLAHLVRFYCKDEELEKQYQLADWRVRPLPDELIMYARKDTHYLLYCYDRLRQDLLDRGNEQQNLLRGVYTRSRDICLIEYEKHLYHPDDYQLLLKKSRKRFNPRQEYALKQLYAWRDNLARTEDESYPYVLPDHMLLQIAEVLPREVQGIWACCSPVPPLIRQDSQALHRIILQARAVPLDKHTVRSSQTEALTTRLDAGHDLTTLNEMRPHMMKHHDFSHSAVDEEIIPFSQRFVSAQLVIPVKSTPILVLFGAFTKTSRSPGKKSKRTSTSGDLPHWNDAITPYDQYLLAAAAAAEASEPEKEDMDVENGSRESGTRKRKMFSHLDPPDTKRKKLQSDEPTCSTEPDVQVEKESKRSQKKKRRKPDPAVEGSYVEEVEVTSRKRVKKDKTEIKSVSYDYESTDKTMFSKGPSTEQESVFDPHMNFRKKRNKSKQKIKRPKGATGTLSSSAKKSASALASFDSQSSKFTKGKKSGKW